MQGCQQGPVAGQNRWLVSHPLLATFIFDMYHTANEK